MPGAIVILSGAYLIGGYSRFLALLKESKTYLVAFGFAAYLAGLSIHAIGTMGYQSDSWPFVRLYSASQLSSSSLDFALQDAEFNVIHVVINGEAARGDRLERFSALKQIYGNLAVAILFLGICVFLRLIKDGRIEQRRMVRKGGRPALLFLFFAALSFILWSEHRKLVIKEEVWRELMFEATIPSSFSVDVPQGRFVSILEQLRNSSKREHKEQVERLVTFLRAVPRK